MTILWESAGQGAARRGYRFCYQQGNHGQENSAVRKYLAQRADLIGAIRLPDNTFQQNAGTKVTSDILFLQKRDHITDLEPDWLHLDTDENGIRMNSYFVQHPEMILGDMVMESTRFGPDSACKAREGKICPSSLPMPSSFAGGNQALRAGGAGRGGRSLHPCRPHSEEFQLHDCRWASILPGKQPHAPGGSLRHGGKPYPWHDRAAGMCPQAH